MPHARSLAAMLPIVLIVLGLWLGGHPEDLPGFVRDAFVADHQTRVVDEAIERIDHDYYRPISHGEALERVDRRAIWRAWATASPTT